MVRKLYTIHYNSEINVGGIKKKTREEYSEYYRGW